MYTFSNIKELILALKREEKLLSEMFSKRKHLDFKYEDALSLVDFEDSRLQYLIDRSLIRKNDDSIEIDDIYLQFFEQVLEVNEEINVLYIDENIQSIKEIIGYYEFERNEKRKYNYLRQIKNILRKIGVTTLRNEIDLRRNIEATFKNEPNYKIKKQKLENLDLKRESIYKLINQTYYLLDKDYCDFFSEIKDEELRRVIVDLKYKLNEAYHNLIEIQKQIIDYLNQIKHQGNFIEKLRKVKYLKDQFTLRVETNIDKIVEKQTAQIYEKSTKYPVNLSTDFLTTDSYAHELIRKISAKHKINARIKPDIAENINADYLNQETITDRIIDPEDLKNSFVQTSYELYDFLSNFNYGRKLEQGEILSLFCQLVSRFDNEFNITGEYKIVDQYELAIIYPK
ncbi:MAG: hypothetical protein N4A49_10840 [Marinifilaceae bacterium]|jgi:hypothetical protein|nr:hypothetical protein [Marinifilaceae bacterium]